MIGKRFGNLIVIQEDKEKDTDGSYKYICQCDCGNIKSISGCSLRDGTTKSCGCIQYSIGEKNIQKILNENNLKYIKEYKITELNNKRFDFAIFNNENIIRLIEFDGRQHYESY